MILAFILLALAAVLAFAAWLWWTLEDARLTLADLHADLARLAEPLPPHERVERRRVPPVSDSLPAARPGMSTCNRHGRWTEIRRADGTTARRDCPECPGRRGMRIVNQYTREVLGRVAIPLEARP